MNNMNDTDNMNEDFSFALTEKTSAASGVTDVSLMALNNQAALAEKYAEPHAVPTPSVPDTTAPTGKKIEPNNAPIHWKDLYVGNTSCVPDKVTRLCGVQDANVSDDEREYRICSTINRSWYATHYDGTRERVRYEWPELRRRLAGELNVADDEREIYMALSARYDEQYIKDTVSKAYSMAYKSGMDNEKIGDVSEFRRSIPSEYHAGLDAVVAKAYEDGRELYERYESLADTLSSGINGMVALEDDFISAPGFLSASPDLLEAVDTLAEMPKKERDIVFYFAVKKNREERGDDEDEGIASRAHRSYQRGIVQIGSSLWEAFGYQGSAIMSGVGESLGGSFGDFLKESGEGLDKRIRIMREIKEAAQNDVLPLVTADSSDVEKIFLTVAESAPAAVVSCTGVAGFLTLATSSMGSSVGSARLRSPDADLTTQLGYGALSGAVQAGLFIGMNKLGTHMLERTINSFMKKNGLGAQVFSWSAVQTGSKTAVDGASMFVAGKAASVTDLAFHELAAQVSGVDSGIDWSQYEASLTDEDVNMREAASILPFLLLGSGRMSLSHLRSPDTLIGGGDRLAAFGIPEKKIQGIMNERDIAKRDVLLREAIVESPWWNDPALVHEAVQAMRLLNTDYFKGFERADVVRKFLNLPAESSMLQRPDYARRTHEEIINTPNHALQRSGYRSLYNSKRSKEGIALWDEWWVRSHITSYPSHVMMGMQQLTPNADIARYERTKRYLEDLNDSGKGVPARMRKTGVYAPSAENERRALLRDRVAEIQDLSYQFLLNAYPLDSILFKDQPISKIKADGERAREEFLGAVGRAVIRAGQGVPHKENMKELSEGFQQYYLRKKYRTRGASVKWIKELPADYLSKMDEYARNPEEPRFNEHPELMEAYRIYLGMRSNTELLIELIPMMEDFQTALARGMTPAQAYALIIERELGYNPDKLRSYPHDQLDYPANKTPMDSYTLQNAELCKKYMRLSGAEMEQSVGDDGQTYWRLRRPDGSYSRWHENESFAMNDVAANAALTFMPLGQGIQVHWKRAILSDKVDLNSLPMAAETQFSGYDQLCSYALRDLNRQWVESAPYFQLGLVPERARHRFVRNADYGDGLSPVYREYVENEGKLSFDVHTMATPYGMASARFYTYWKRALDTGVVPETQVEDFLLTLGDGWLKNLSAVDPLADAKIRHAALARDMGDFSVCYFIMRVPELPLPPTVKEWFGYAAFCPPEPTTEIMPNVVPLERGHTGVVRWSNRRIATQLQELSPQVEQLRELFGSEQLQHELVSEHLPRAMGLDINQNREQSWGFYHCGEDALHAVSPVYWELLHSPERGWELLPDMEKADLINYVAPFLAENPPPGLQPGQDAVSVALANLNAMLSRNPELHAYSLNGAATEQLMVMELPMLPGMTAGFTDAPLYKPLEFYYPQGMRQRSGIMRAESAQYAEIDTPEAQHAIRFLDTLRRYPSSLPYVTDSGIWWNNVRYGGKTGKVPNGLESHKPVRPLVRIVKLLKEVNELCLTKDSEYMNFCGVPIPKVTPEELAHPALTSMTVYRMVGGVDAVPKLTYFSRLMPGEPSSGDFRERHPYVVEVRDGMYLTDNAIVRDATNPLLTMRPLPLYTKAQMREFNSETQRELYEVSFSSSLNALYDIEKMGPEFMETRRSGEFSLQELLMRLYEDTNFSGGVIGNKSIHELDARELRALRLAADIISCVVAPRQASHPAAVRAFDRLKKTLKLILRDEAYRDSLEHTLFKGNEELKTKILKSIKR